MATTFVIIRLLFHTLATAIYVVGILKFPGTEVINIINDLTAKKHNLTLIPEATFGGNFKYLTFWDVVCIFFIKMMLKLIVTIKLFEQKLTCNLDYSTRLLCPLLSA